MVLIAAKIEMWQECLEGRFDLIGKFTQPSPPSLTICFKLVDELRDWQYLSRRREVQQADA